MTAGLTLVRRYLAKRLEDAGIPTVQAWEKVTLPALTACAAVLGVEESESAPAALWDYLGLALEEESGQTVERYGRRLALRISIDLYAPRNQAPACEEALERLEELLLEQLCAGLRVEKLQRGEMRFDSASGYLKCRCSAHCTAYFTASRADEAATLTDFELKGVVT